MKRPCAWCGLRPAAYSVTDFCSPQCQGASWNMGRPKERFRLYELDELVWSDGNGYFVLEGGAVKYSDIEPAFREAIGTFEALRKMGFSSDDIFFGVGGELKGLGYQFYVKLETQGKDFTVITGFVKDEPEKIRARWQEIAEQQPTMEQSLLDEVWQRSVAFLNFAAIGQAINDKGIFLPNLQN